MKEFLFYYCIISWMVIAASEVDKNNYTESIISRFISFIIMTAGAPFVALYELFQERVLGNYRWRD